MYNVIQCTLYSIQCTMYSVHCTLESKYCGIYTAYTLHNILCTLYKGPSLYSGDRGNYIYIYAECR